MCDRCKTVLTAARRLDVELGVALRKARSPRRYDRGRREGRLRSGFRAWLREGFAALLEYLQTDGRLEALREYVTAYHPAPVAESVTKAKLTSRDKNFLAELLTRFAFWSDQSLEEMAAVIVELHHFPCYEDAAKFALGKLGLDASDFELRNPAIRDLILARKEVAYNSAREGIDRGLAAMVEHLAEAGDGPYNNDLLRRIQSAFGEISAAHALRFAQTEIGFVAEHAQRDTFRECGVGYKAWRHSGRGPGSARPNHKVLDGTVIKMDAKFHLLSADGSESYACDGPMDPTLPASEVVNCGCTTDPVFDAADADTFRQWDGA